MDTRHAHGTHTYLKAKHSYIQNKSKIKKEKKTGGVIKEDISFYTSTIQLHTSYKTRCRPSSSLVEM